MDSTSVAATKIPQNSRGQWTLCSRSSTRRLSTAISIVQWLTQSEQFGNSLDVSVHQHFGYKMQYMWNGAFGNRRFERRFGSYKTVQALFTDIVTRTLEGTCNSITGRAEFLDVDPGSILDLWFDKLKICHVPPPLSECLDGPYSTVRLEREYQESYVGAINNSLMPRRWRRCCINKSAKSFFLTCYF
jgi:hypothetical protein